MICGVIFLIAAVVKMVYCYTFLVTYFSIDNVITTGEFTVISVIWAIAGIIMIAGSLFFRGKCCVKGVFLKSTIPMCVFTVIVTLLSIGAFGYNWRVVLFMFEKIGYFYLYFGRGEIWIIAAVIVELVAAFVTMLAVPALIVATIISIVIVLKESSNRKNGDLELSDV